jgi:predicted HTH domain antitoxin
MEVTLHIPDDVAQQLSAEGRDLSLHLLEALALDGYRRRVLTLYQVGEMLGLSRIETEDFLGQNQVPLADLSGADLDQDAAAVDAAFRRRKR